MCLPRRERGPVRMVDELEEGEQDGPFFATVWAQGRVEINRYVWKREDKRRSKGRSRAGSS